jgi:hypothetical protein
VTPATRSHRVSGHACSPRNTRAFRSIAAQAYVSRYLCYSPSRITRPPWVSRVALSLSRTMCATFTSSRQNRPAVCITCSPAISSPGAAAACSDHCLGTTALRTCGRCASSLGNSESHSTGPPTPASKSGSLVRRLTQNSKLRSGRSIPR